MREEQESFIKILSDYLNSRTGTKLPADTSRIIDYAHKHEVEAIVYKQTHLPELKTKFMFSLSDYRNRLRVLSDIDEAFRNAGIEYFLVKGTELARFYPDSYLRQMGDSDIVVRNVEAAVSTLKSMGYDIQGDPYHEIHFMKNGMDFELHSQLLYDEEFNEENLRTFFNDCWPYVQDDKVDDNFHFLFTVAHLRKHFLWEGVGFRQFMDVALYSKQDLDWKWIREKLEYLNLLDFTNTCMALIFRWFGIENPLGPSEITDEFYKKATDTIFENGVFGKVDEHYIAILANKRNNNSKKKLYLKSIFPSYSDMRVVPYYRFLDGKPWLLPFAWVYRWCTAWKKARQHIEEIHNSDDIIETKKQQLKEWKI